jgi:hypothetical protein
MEHTIWGEPVGQLPRGVPLPLTLATGPQWAIIGALPFDTDFMGFDGAIVAAHPRFKPFMIRKDGSRQEIAEGLPN